MDKPTPSEYADFYQGYISQVINKYDFYTFLEYQGNQLVHLVSSIPANQWQYAYAPDKWTIAEVIGHIIETERVMVYRAMRFSKNDKTPLAGFDQDAFVRESNFKARSKASLMREFKGVRASTIEFFKHLTEAQSLRTGEANGSIFSVRALAYIVAGHLEHHLSILNSKYLNVSI